MRSFLLLNVLHYSNREVLIGVFAILYILHYNFVILFTIAIGGNLNVMEFKQSELRRHLADHFRGNQLQPFPHIIAPAAILPCTSN